MYKYLEMNNIYVNKFLSSIANLKCTPGGAFTLGWEPLFCHMQ